MLYCIQPSKCKNRLRKGLSIATIWVFMVHAWSLKRVQKAVDFWALKLFILWAFAWARLWKSLNLHSNEFRFLIELPCGNSRSWSYFQGVNWNFRRYIGYIGIGYMYFLLPTCKSLTSPLPDTTGAQPLKANFWY